MNAGESGVGDGNFTDRPTAPGDHVDHSWRQPSRFEQLHREVRRQLLGRCWLPDDRVAHQGWRRWQVPGNGCEVKGRDCQNETLERTVVEAVPYTWAADRLLFEDLPREGHVEPPEVSHFARRVDLRLVGGLALAEHRGRVERGSPWSGEQVRCLQENCRTVIKGRALPRSRSGCRTIDCLPYVVGGRIGQGAQLRLSPMRLNNLDRLATAQPGSVADCHRQLALVRGHLLQPGLELGSFGTAWRVIQDRLVDWRRHVRYGVHRTPHPFV